MPKGKVAGRKAAADERREQDDSAGNHKLCAAFLVSESQVIQLAKGERGIRIAHARSKAIAAGFVAPTINCVLQGGAFSGPMPGCNGADTYVLRLGSKGIQDLLEEFSGSPHADTEQGQKIVNGIQRLLGDLAK